jgi:hypothetical protein
MRVKIILIVLLLSLNTCSYISDAIWSPEGNDFTITLIPGDAEIQVNITRSDHSNSGFKGYFIYRNTESPYEDFNLRAIDSFIDTGGPYEKTKEANGSVTQITETNPGIYTDACVLNKVNYYRVVVVYMEGGEQEDRAKSGWKAAACVSQIITPNP